jgi:hypothetical protein
MFSPQFTKYSRSFTLAVLAASFKFWRTLLANLSLPTSRGASAVAALAALAPNLVKSLLDLKSP